VNRVNWCLALAVCGAVSCTMGGPCGEFRTTSTAGDIIGDPGILLGRVRLDLVEGHDRSRSTLTVMVDGVFLADSGRLSAESERLRGHIVRLRLLGAGARELFVPVVRQFMPPPGATPGSLLIDYITIVVEDTVQLADLREQFLAGTIAVEMTTNEAPARIFTISTSRAESSDWIQVICL
jgi:hypothetical protein